MVLVALAAARDAGDAVVILPPEAPASTIPATIAAALAGQLAVPADTAVVVATSGSTGTPRSIVLSHAALAAAVAATHARLGARQGECWALALPVRHVAGLMVLLRARALGTAPVVVSDPGDPATIAGAAAAAQHVALVPTQLGRALDAGVDLSAFRTVLLGGGPATADLVARARAAGIRVVTSYGMTETCGGCVYDGEPLDGIEVAIDASGCIRLRGPSVATHELDGTPLRDADGWFTTSDLGRLEGGRLEVFGRADDVIISGGSNIDPVAVADTLRAHPSVDDAVVIGVPDAEWGQVVRAAVVAVDAVDLVVLRAHVAERLGRTHAPRELLVVDRIVRDGLGKVSAAERARLAALPPTAAHAGPRCGAD